MGRDHAAAGHPDKLTQVVNQLVVGKDAYRGGSRKLSPLTQVVGQLLMGDSCFFCQRPDGVGAIGGCGREGHCRCQDGAEGDSSQEFRGHLISENFGCGYVHVFCYVRQFHFYFLLDAVKLPVLWLVLICGADHWCGHDGLLAFFLCQTHSSPVPNSPASTEKHKSKRRKFRDYVDGMCRIV